MRNAKIRASTRRVDDVEPLFSRGQFGFTIYFEFMHYISTPTFFMQNVWNRIISMGRLLSEVDCSVRLEKQSIYNLLLKVYWLKKPFLFFFSLYALNNF